MASSQPQSKLDVHKIAVATWLGVMSVVGLVKIIVGSMYIDSGCLGLCFLPYYLLFAGILALIPAALAVTATWTKQRDSLEELWNLMAKLFLLSVAFIIAGTIYILSSVVRVSSLDRLCTHSWVPVFGLCAIAGDWLLLLFFYRLFCMNKLPQVPDSPSSTPPLDSPFRAWKERQNRGSI